MTTYLIRIINLDSYMSPPVQGLDVVYSDFRGALINQVPIIRLFGSTPTGQKICVHIHGVFPYFYIPYDGTQEVNSLMHHIAISIDKAVNISLNQASSKTQHVYKISLVSGIPMYGYHNKKHQFLKVYLYNPLLIRKVGNLLMNETTLGKIYQPHEIHLSFPLQFMIDYNLHGMSNMILSDMKFRKDPTCVNPEISPERYLPLTISKVTVCELEGDAFADDIVNRQEIASGNIGVNPGIFALWADEKQRRRNKGETSQIEHLLELKRTDVEPTKSHLLYKQALLERLAILSTDVERPTEEKLNLSVYPAETPDNVSIQNASLIDIHTPSSVELSLDDTLISSSSNPNDTVLATQNMSMDAEARNLLEILRELGENVRDDEEDDSLLTQIVKEDEEEDKFLDLSMPLEAVTTPKKIITQEEAASESEDELDKTLIPQLDGEWDSGDEGSSSNPGLGQRNEDNRKNVKQRLVKKVLYVKLINEDVKREKNMPLLDFEPSWESYAFSNQNTNTSEDCINPCNEDKSHLSSLIVTDKFNKSLDDVNNILIKNVVEDTILNKKKRLPRPADVILQERIRILGYHIKRLKRQNQLIRIIRKTHRKEHNICVLVSKKGKPKFNVISKTDMLAQQNGCKEWNNENTDNKQSRASSSICSPKETFAPYKNLRRSSRISSPKYQEINSKMFIDLCLSESDTDSECSFSTESSNSSFVPSINKRKNWAKKLVTNLCKLPIQNSLKQDVKNTSKMCLSFDGSKDSSSSEDDGSELKKIKHLKKQGVDSASRYSALPVSIVSSPISYGPAGKHLVSQNANTTSEKKKAPLNRSQQTFCDNSVKRRLSFSNNPRLQTTMIEEKVVCSLSPKDRKEHIIEEEKLLQNSQHINAFDSQNSNSKNNFQKDNLEKFEEGIFIEKSDNINKDEDQTTNSLSDSEDEISESFFRSSQSTNKHLCLPLTAAEKYDKETNYIAKEGSSKEFTNTDLHVSIYNKKNSNESSGSSSLDLLTPYQRVANAENINLSAFKENEENEYINKISDDLFSSGTSENQISLEETSKKLPENSYTASKFVITIPLKKAPSKGDVFKSLDLNKIPYVKEEMPFYSNVADVTGSVEVGYNVLKINSRTTMHFPEFESQTDSINTFRKFKLESLSSNLRWKKSNLKHTILKFCDDRSCIITPAKKPPSVELVKTWLREKSKTATTTVKKAAKIKVFLPTSPGHDGDDDDNTMDISLTLSPCTPSNSQSDASQKVIQNSLDSSQVPLSSSPDSPVLARRGKSYKKRQKKSLLPQSLTPSLRKSLLLSQDKSQLNQSCQITGVTANNTYGFDKSIENLQQARAVVEHQNLTLLVMELHIRTRVDFKPNPELDPICAIFYSVLNDVADNHPKASNSKGVVVINSLPLRSEINSTLLLDGAAIDCKIDYVSTEENLFTEFLKIINYWDPDIISGYEIEMLSWGYLIERANILGINLKPLVARTKDSSLRWKDEERQEDLKITGRIVLDVWRLMRHEIALQSYTFESIVYHILHKRVPHYSFRDLSFWWDHRSNVYRHRTAHYYLFRVVTILELFDKLDLIGRTSELARLFGIQFFEVLSRGSQFRVESMMLRLAKPLNYIPVSPSVQQRAKMKAPEYIALVLEPESKLYNDPVIVLDFQSLYPSIIIAYNYCFTTCVGRVECLGKNTPFEFGASQLRISKKRLEKLLKEDLLNFSPCGVGFVKKMVRDGILPRMLREILDTRLMVKNAMKENTDDQILQKVLHNRQLGLKLIANVTYGYTAANFSGRMPSVEVGDSVVSKGRETLQRAIEMVETTAEWGARVVYGDTDSLFVLVPGRSRERAFEVGKKIADAVTKANPDPIKLKMEKIYQPCILQTKKRYVGYMYESPDQKEPVYDAKGIETVRRDGCPAVSKMLEKCLRILFETKDVSLVKKYVLRQFNKIIAGRASIQDLTFAKEYRGAAGYRPGACVPALELARKWKAIDKRSEPRSGERVPYIIVSGPPGLPLIRLVRSPMDLLNDSSLRPNALYYITRVIIPPINRCFNLIGADLNTWFNQMPRKQIQYLPNSVSPAKKSTISQYFSTTSCIACAEQTQMGICDKCYENPQVTTITLMEKLREWEEKCYTCNLICQSCSSSQTEVKCVSLDCPILYRRVQTNRDLLQAAYVRQLLCSSDFLF